MAILNRERGVVVLKIVYDGLPFSGKTTSLRALANDLARTLYSPGESAGRTVYFDWLDWKGGRFEGLTVRCQVLSLPGQRTLVHRRRHLLEGADAVVFVADSQRDAMAANLDHLDDLLTTLADQGEPRVGVVVQANKRDLDGAVPLEELRRALAARRRLAVVESVAVTAEGIRESFVLAVRLALDRVRALMARGSLPEGRPVVETGEAMFERLRRLEKGLGPSEGDGPPPEGTLAGRALDEVLADQSSAAPSGAGRDAMIPKDEDPENEDPEDEVLEDEAPEDDVPGDDVPGDDVPEEGPGPVPTDASVATGRVWPPVEGRVVLHDALGGPTPAPRRDDAGGWRFDHRGYRFHSPSGAAWASPDGALEALRFWARRHSAVRRHLSARRSILAVEGTGGRTRLWQVVAEEPTGHRLLRRWLVAADGADDGARLLVELVRELGALSTALAGREPELSVGLDAVGLEEERPVFAGLFPPPVVADEVPGATGGRLRNPGERIRAELAPALAEAFRGPEAPELDRHELAEAIRLRGETGDLTASMAEALAAAVRGG